MEIKTKRFLPIGTVVMLKGGVKPVMVTSYCILPMGDVYDKDGKVDKTKIIYYEYGACLYPEGVQRTKKTFVFNHNQIDKILHYGYQSEQCKLYTKKMDEAISELDNRKESILEEREMTKVHLDIPILDM